MTPRVVLIGPPGAGKTSIGRALAKSLKLDFADTDTLIEGDQGKSVSQIFVDEGESFFRKVEEGICIEALKNEIGVLALGGGAVLTPTVAKGIKEAETAVIFLDVSLAVAAPRIGFNRDRPLLLSNPRQKWQSLMDVRRPIYESLATTKIDVGDRSVTAIVDEILLKVNI